MPNFFTRLFKKPPPLTSTQRAETEREQRIATRNRVDYSYTVFWTKNARLWDKPKRAEMLRRVNTLIQSPEFSANPYNRNYPLEGIDGSYSGASLLALQKVLEALSDD